MDMLLEKCGSRRFYERGEFGEPHAPTGADACDPKEWSKGILTGHGQFQLLLNLLRFGIYGIGPQELRLAGMFSDKFWLVKGSCMDATLMRAHTVPAVIPKRMCIHMQAYVCAYVFLVRSFIPPFFCSTVHSVTKLASQPVSQSASQHLHFCFIYWLVYTDTLACIQIHVAA